MYLREMGSVELLSREGEIAIAKRIEAGRDKMIGSICASPLMVESLIGWRDRLLAERMLLRDIIDLAATYGGDPSANGGGSGEAVPNGEAVVQEIGRASCRERVCQNVESSGGAGSLKKKTKTTKKEKQ